MGHTLKKYFNNFAGLSFSVPELLRDSTYATDLKNVRLSENLSLTKRRGFQISALEENSGSVTFNEVEIAKGTQTQKRLVFSDTVKELKPNSLNLTYSGSLLGQAEFKLDPTTQTFKLNLYEDGALIQEIDCGTGREGAPYSINSLVSAVSSPFAAALDSASTANAAFIYTTLLTTVTASITSFAFNDATAVGTVTGHSTPFSGHWATRTNSDFQNISTIQAHDVLYLTNGVDGLHKYDGTRLYKAGLPIPAKPASASEDVAAASKWVYRVVYDYTDAKQNLVVSSSSEELTVDSTLAPITVTVDVSDLATGYDTDGTINVYLYRTTANGTIFYLVEAKTYADNVAGTVSFTDSTIDTTLALSTEYAIPARNPNPAPNCRYIDIWRNQIVLTGNAESVNTVYVADVEFIEGFDFRNSFETSSRLGQANSGIKSLDNFLFTTKPTSVSITTGDITDFTTIQTDAISDSGIGALSHDSIIEAEGSLFFIARDGIYKVNSQGLELISNPLNPLFYNYDFTQNRCISFYWPNERKLIFHLPSIVSGANVVADARTLVYDLFAKSWYVWDNIDLVGGMNQDQQDVWFAGSNEISNFLFLRSKEDYADHENAVNFLYKSHWETLQEPSVAKKFLRLKVFTIDTEFQSFESTDFTLDIETNHDYSTEPVSIVTIDFGEDTDGWGAFSWGDTPWGEVKSSVRATRLAARRAQSLRTTFKNEVIHENVLISGFELEISPMFDTFIKDK